jgi:valyl-tRNA synthetase
LLALIDQYGADAVRFGILIASPAGNDLLFDDSSLEQGRNFNNKLWNAMKLVRMWGERTSTLRPPLSALSPGADRPSTTLGGNQNFAVQWFESRLSEAMKQLDELFADFRLSEALKITYSLVWDDFCSWYLEWIKPAQGEQMDAQVYEKTIYYFDQLLQLLHPFMPFISEEIYHLLKERQEGDDLVISQYAAIESANKTMLEKGEMLKQVITAIRDARAKNNIKPKEPIKLHIQTSNEQAFHGVEGILL